MKMNQKKGGRQGRLGRENGQEDASEEKKGLRLLVTPFLESLDQGRHLEHIKGNLRNRLLLGSCLGKTCCWV